MGEKLFPTLKRINRKNKEKEGEEEKEGENNYFLKI